MVTVIPPTAGNVMWKLSPPSGKMYRILYSRITLTTDATVGNRNIGFAVLNNADNVVAYLPASGTITANMTGNASLCPMMYGLGMASPDNAILAVCDLWIPYYTKFAVVIHGGLAGDSYSGYIAYLESDTP